MADITVRNLPAAAHRGLKQRAAQHNRSMEAEARAILEAAVCQTRDPIGNWLAASADVGKVALELPERSMPRGVDLS